VNKLQILLEDVHDRLAGVTIERLPWQDFLARYDRPGTLFYLDPPYFGCEDDYGADMFGRDQFELMAEQLAGLKGEFILSINDTPEVRRIFSRFRFQEAKLLYRISGAPTEAAELIIFGP
jgi:DNA adenine methylase